MGVFHFIERNFVGLCSGILLLFDLLLIFCLLIVELADRSESPIPDFFTVASERRTIFFLLNYSSVRLFYLVNLFHSLGVYSTIISSILLL